MNIKPLEKKVVWVCPHCHGLIARASGEEQASVKKTKKKRRKPAYNINWDAISHALKTAFHEYNRPVTAKEIARELRKSYPGMSNQLVSARLSSHYTQNHDIKRHGKRGSEYLYYPTNREKIVVKHVSGREKAVKEAMRE